MEKINGTTLYIKHESGNIGHYFNDHVYSPFSYYLKNKETIDSICIELTDVNIQLTLIEHFNKKLLLGGKGKAELNFNMLIVFFYDCGKNIYFQDIKTPKYNFEILINPEPDRFFKNSTNYLEVFNTLRNNYKLYTKQNNIINERVDATLLYRNDGKDRNICNIEILESIFKKNNIKYKFFNVSGYYNFEEIVDIFFNSDNIISFHGCELTYGIFMSKNTQIIELTSMNHNESWWVNMEKYYVIYGLIYTRLSVDVFDQNLYFNIFNLLKIKYFDNFASVGESCDNTISLHNINYKNG